MLSKEDLKDIETKASSVLLDAGSFIMDHWQDVHEISYKNERDSATEIDSQAENLIRDQLSKILPAAGFIVEEGSSEEKAEYNWVIDPIDGTKQFVSQMPLFNTQIALMYKGEPVLGIVYNPVSKQLFSASKGNGATLNSEQLKADINRSPKESIVDVDFGGNSDTVETRMHVLTSLVTSFYRVRMFAGIYGLYILTGALDATISIFGRINVFDYAPHDIILTEAGVRVEYEDVEGIGKVRYAGYPQSFDKLKEIIGSLSK